MIHNVRTLRRPIYDNFSGLYFSAILLIFSNNTIHIFVLINKFNENFVSIDIKCAVITTHQNYKNVQTMNLKLRPFGDTDTDRDKFMW